MDKPTKPTDLMPRQFGGVKNNFSASLQYSGYEDGVPAIYGGDNLNYQLDSTGKELDYCEKIVDFINNIPIGKTITVDANNKLVYSNYTDGADVDLSNLSSTGQAKLDNKVSKSGDTMTGILKVQTPQASSDNNEVATTEWVNDKGYTTLTTYENGLSGYVIFINGYCIQWGAVHGTTSVQGDKTITFAKTFKNTNFNFIFSYTNNNGSLSMNDCGYEVHTSRTTNSVVLHSTTNIHGYSWKACGFLASGQY